MADVLIDARIFGGGVNFSGQSNKVELAFDLDEADTTVFEPANPADRGWKERTGTVLDAKASIGGFWNAGDPGKVDNALWAGLGLVDVWSFIKGTGAVGDVAYTLRSLQSKYQLIGGDHGKVAPFEASLAGSGFAFRGQVAHPHTTPRAAAGNGATVQLLDNGGGVPAGQYLYAALHLQSVAGTSTPTLTAVVESDDNAGFTTPVTRLTFAPATARGGQLLRVAGPITDTFYRVKWTVSGGTPSFLFAATIGVAPA